MRQVLIITNSTLPNIIFPENWDKFILTYRYLTDEQVIKEIKNNTCRSFFAKKEVLNLFKIGEKIQVVEAKEVKLKVFDKILLKDESGRFIILELVETKKYFKLLKKLKEV